MLGFFPAGGLAVTDATAAVTVEQSAVTGITPGGGYGIALTSVDGAARIVSRASRAAFLLDISGRYGRALASTQGATSPQDIAGTAVTRLDVVTSPRTAFSISADALLASRLGLRATNDLTARDPFLQGRVIYTLGSRVGFSASTSPRSYVRFEAGYTQAGAVAADHPEAVGLDSHAVLGSASFSWLAGRRFRIGPIVRAGFTHFEHALLDVDLTRGPADITTVSALGSATFEISRRIRGGAALGLTVASPPSFLQDESSGVIAPDARIDARYAGRGYGVVGTYSFSYSSLGPRIGFGAQHAAGLELWSRPRGGREFRSVIARGILRFRHGEAPLATQPRLGLPPGTPQPEGKFVTTAVAAGGSLGMPLTMGILVTGGVDLELISTRFEPDPTGASAPTFRTMVTVAISAIASTDPMRRVPRDPDLQDQDARPGVLEEEEARAAGGRPRGQETKTADEDEDAFYDE
ncbi:hypothetical protein [Polyangium mundeleinium]|uniref:DUF5723 domain-containing protein n=1 Tax=Polyangium mundeleinium TaxID=2995306 RepID=A0ABT5EUM7_9BACT|nr:hypothetical protein [Polyangium mundeleinium]MDC0745531.1 hypothetical protein [Polyangium mundeleinium]